VSTWTKDSALQAYGAYRIMDQVSYYTRQAERYERARRRALAITASLFVLVTLFGALGTVDEPRRGVWAFAAAGLAALGTAVTSYESAFSFEPLARQYRDTVAALKLAEAKGPAPEDVSLAEYVRSIELILRSEVETWSRLSVDLNTLAGIKPPEEPKTDAAPSRRR
jgi:SMODS and SLOG-associating 2TM effector domain 1